MNRSYTVLHFNSASLFFISNLPSKFRALEFLKEFSEVRLQTYSFDTLHYFLIFQNFKSVSNPSTFCQRSWLKTFSNSPSFWFKISKLRENHLQWYTIILRGKISLWTVFPQTYFSFKIMNHWKWFFPHFFYVFPQNK